jgi:hypothetical protein
MEEANTAARLPLPTTDRLERAGDARSKSCSERPTRSSIDKQAVLGELGVDDFGAVLDAGDSGAI